MYRWMLALHLCGVLVWFAGAMISVHLLRAHQRRAGAKPEDFRDYEGAAGRLLDVGAAVAIVAGLWMLLENLGLLRAGGFMHAKLTLVVVLLGIHGFLRGQLKRFRTGKSHQLAAWVQPVTLVAFFAIVVLIITRPF